MLDDEVKPTMGGIYMASLTPHPKLTTFVGIGDRFPVCPAPRRDPQQEG